MTRLIDAEVFIETLIKIDPALRDMPVKLIVKAIEMTPKVDAMPIRHGYWIKHGRGKLTFYECSNCGEMNDDITNTYEPRQRYCPMCGAKMVKDE